MHVHTYVCTYVVLELTIYMLMRTCKHPLTGIEHTHVSLTGIDHTDISLAGIDHACM